MTARRWLVLFVLGSVVAGAAGCKRRSTNIKPVYDLGKLDWMVGVWSSENKKKRTTHEEMWARPHLNLMLGLNRTLKRDKVISREYLQIADVNGTLVYTAWPESQPMTSFKLTVRGDRRAVFENPAHDFPQRILYWRDEEGLHAQLDGTVHGQRRRSDWLWKHQVGRSYMTGRRLSKTQVVSAPRAEVWKAWTTSKGAETFFAPDALIEGSVGGRYELHFDPEAPKGKRGSEGCILVELDPEKSLAFTWNFPPSLPTIRDAHTLVRVRLTPASKGKTRVDLEQEGWRHGDAWDEGYLHFDNAWDLVLQRLKQRFDKGPLDWAKIAKEQAQQEQAEGDQPAGKQPAGKQPAKQPAAKER